MPCPARVAERVERRFAGGANLRNIGGNHRRDVEAGQREELASSGRSAGEDKSMHGADLTRLQFADWGWRLRIIGPCLGANGPRHGDGIGDVDLTDLVPRRTVDEAEEDTDQSAVSSEEWVPWSG